jgi:hypothetical protein
VTATNRRERENIIMALSAAKVAVPERVVRFGFLKETKSTYVYDEQLPELTPPMIGRLYIKKWTLGTTAPANIEVVIRAPSSDDA